MNGYEIYQRFVDELVRAGKKISDFCKATGISQGAISNWGKRGTMPSAELVIAISEYLDCSTDYVLGKTNIRNATEKGIEFSLDEKKIIDLFRDADEEEKQLILKLVELSARKNKAD